MIDPAPTPAASTRLRRRAERVWRRVWGSFAHRFGIVTHVRTRLPVAALTFDDGPHPVWTPRLLDLLAQHGAKATFFMVGEMMQRHPDVVRRVVAEGHAIGNHSWNHPSFSEIGAAERRRQIDAWETVAGGPGARLFRPPYGDLDRRSRWLLLRRGYRVIGWNVSVADWERSDADALAAELERKTKPGCIVLLHDQLFTFAATDHPSRERILEAVAHLLAASELRFVTVPALLGAGHAQGRLWRKRSDSAWLRDLESVSGLGFRY